MNKFKRCPIQPLPGEGVLCQSCQRRLVKDPFTPYPTMPTTICIPLYKPIKQLIGGVWQEIYPILERTTPGGKPIPNERLKENYLDTEFQETCNLYIDELDEQA